MKRSDYRGVSQILITVIMIGLVLVAIGVVWVVISNLLSEKSGEVSSGNSIIDLEVRNILINGDGNVSVFVERDAKRGNFAGVRFIISDGTNQYFYDREGSINNLETKIYVLNYSGVIESIEVAPISEINGGKAKSGNVVDKFEPGYENSLKGINGLISWWRFEENANDTLGRNNGTVYGNLNSTLGKVGNTYSFDGANDHYIQIPNSATLYMSSNLTMSAWIKIASKSGVHGIVGMQGDGAWAQGYDLYYDDNSNLLIMMLGNATCGMYCGGSDYLFYSVNLEDNQWHHVAGSFNRPNAYLYLDGNLVNTSIINKDIINRGVAGGIGSFGMPPDYEAYWFNGTIDEVMIFNRSLSADEVKAIYDLSLSKN